MKFTQFFTFVAMLFAVSVLASPIGEPAASNGLEVSKRGVLDLELIVGNCKKSILDLEIEFRGYCKDKRNCRKEHVSSYCSRVAKVCRDTVATCKSTFPNGHHWAKDPLIIVRLCVDIIISISLCLKFLLGQCGIIVGLVCLIGSLLGDLIAALNALLGCIGLYVSGLLGLCFQLLVSLNIDITILTLCGLILL